MKNFSDYEFFLHTFEVILSHLNEELEVAKKNLESEYREIEEDYLEVIEILRDVLPEITSLNAIENLESDEIDFIYECLQTYADNFVITHRDSILRKQQELEYSRLEKLISMFEISN